MRAVLACFFALSLAGCSSADDGSGSNLGDVSTPEGFCAKTFGKIGELFDTACSPADKQTGTYQFVGLLFQAAAYECPGALKTSIDAGRATIDRDAAAECAAAFAEITASFQSVESLDPALVIECENAIVGQQPTGAPCAQPYECAAGATCVGYTSTSEGTCQAPALGETCGLGDTPSGEITITFAFGNHPDCAGEAFCESRYDNGSFLDLCVARKGEGGSCFAGSECQTGLGCHVGFCSNAAASDAGGACKTGDDCQDGLYCDFSASPAVCTHKKPSGSPCGGGTFSNECVGTCDLPDTAIEGTCVSFCGVG